MSQTAIDVLKKHNQFKDYQILPDLPGGPDDDLQKEPIKPAVDEKGGKQKKTADPAETKGPKTPEPLANPGAENPGEGKNRVPAVVTNLAKDPSK